MPCDSEKVERLSIVRKMLLLHEHTAQREREVAGVNEECAVADRTLLIAPCPSISN